MRDVAYARRAIPAVFELFERYPAADFGSPGPLVHCVEAIGGYHDELRASVARRPTAGTLWMVAKVLRGELDDDARGAWVALLQQVAARGDLDGALRQQAAKLAADRA